MSRISDLAKQGISYQPLEGPATPKEEEDGDFVRGIKKAAYQIPQTIGGTVALAGDLVGSEGMRDYGLGVYQKNADKVQAVTKDSDSLTNVLEGDASGLDWLQNAAGYTAGQAVTAIATGGVGGFIGKQLAMRGIKSVAERAVESQIAKTVAAKVARRGAMIGAGTALFGSNLSQEAGSIYPEAVETARNVDYGDRADGTRKGRGFLGELRTPDGQAMTELSVGVNIGGKEVEIPTIVPTLTPKEIEYLRTGGEPTQEIISKAAAHAQERLAQGQSPFAGADESPFPQVNLSRVVGSSIAAAAVDTGMDALMVGRVMHGGRKAGEGLLKAARREVPMAMGREAVTEGIQTGIERYGAGQELGTADAIRDYVDSMGVGAVGGGLGGGAAVLHSQKVAESGPLTRAANTSIDQQILELTHDPQPLISFPDGSVGTKADMAAYLTQFTDPAERQAKERELMGRDPATGKRMEPEPVPEPEFAATTEEEAGQVKAWADRHDPVTLDYAHSLLAAPGMKGKNMMVAPHPSGDGYTLVPANWLTLDTQAKLGELQKPAPAGKKDDAKPTDAAPEPAAKPAAEPAAEPAAAPAAEPAPVEEPAKPAAKKKPATPAPAEPQSAPQNIPENIQAADVAEEPEWKTNPYTAYKFNDKGLADAFMERKQADPAQFEAIERDGKFVIKRRAESPAAEKTARDQEKIDGFAKQIKDQAEVEKFASKIKQEADKDAAAAPILNPAGKPFMTEFAAKKRMREDKLSATHEIQPAPEGGFVLQPKKQENANAVLPTNDGVAGKGRDQAVSKAAPGKPGTSGAATENAGPAAAAVADAGPVAAADPVHTAGQPDTDAALKKGRDTTSELEAMAEDAGEGFQTNDRAIKAIQRAAQELTPAMKAKITRTINKFTKVEKDGTRLIKPGNEFYTEIANHFAGVSYMLANGIDAHRIEEGAHEAATSPHNDLPEPTEGQKDAGNYKKGHVSVHGLDIAIENPAGSTRRGVSPKGVAWENTMANHYGYIKRTEGADGDHVDTFIGPNPASQRAFVVDQVDPETGKFDEHKIVLGADTIDEARAIYAGNYAKDWTGGKDVTETSVEGLKTWLKDGNTKTPFAPQVASKTGKSESETGNSASEAGKTASEEDVERDDGADIPKAFFKKVKVPHEVYVEETGETETIDLPADQALKSVREDIASLEALIKCMKG
jgi:hypothetical protein